MKTLNYCNAESCDATRNIEQHGFSTCGTDPPQFTAPSITSVAAAALTSHSFKSSHVSFFGTWQWGTLSEVMLRNHFVFWAQVLGFVLPGCIAPVNTWIYDSDLKTLKYCDTKSYGATRNIEQHGISTYGTDPPLFMARAHGGTLSEVKLRNHFVFWVQALGFVLPDCIARVNICIYDSDLKTLSYCKTESYDATRNIEQHGISTCGTDPPLLTATSVLGFVLPGCIARVNTCIYDSDQKTLNYCNTESYDATRNIEQNGISTYGTDPPLFTAPSIKSAAPATLTSHCFKSVSRFVLWHWAWWYPEGGCIARVNTCIYDSDLKTLNYCNTESYDDTRNIEQNGISTCGTNPPLFTALSIA
ncbi:hypothetical protein V5799_001183 [Amblyomma americanum]|uniref:Uncharacterized protein n=1 Tax=Amblyomma americanum TaxID=6943 RepID=A0AAQ4D0Y0_AMBAM